jgi:hypothetical protein
MGTSGFTPNPEVIFMSGYARPVLASQGRLDPGVALVEKPFSEADLLATAGQVLNGHFQGFTTIQGTPPDAVQLPQTEFEGAAFKLSGPPGAVRRAGVLLPAYDDAGPCFEVPVL